MNPTTLLSALLSTSKGAPAAKVTDRFAPCTEFLIPIGSDHTASVTIYDEALPVLESLVDEETWFDRLLAEREDLVIQLTALNKFRGSAPGKALTSENKQLLTQQSKTMQALLQILDERIRINS